MKRLLLIEDFHPLQKLLKRLLVSTEIQYFSVDTAEEALELVDSGEHFDIICCDVILKGGMNGIDFISRVRKLGFLGVVVSMSVDSYFHEEALLAGADYFVNKFDNPVTEITKIIGEMANNGFLNLG